MNSVFFPLPFLYIQQAGGKYHLLYAEVVCGLVSNMVIVVTETASTLYKYHNVIFFSE